VKIENEDPMGIDARERARQLAATEDPLRWFETFYREAGSDLGKIPWADLTPNCWLTDWLDRTRSGQPEQNSNDGVVSPLRALKIGCGVGDDAEELARRGYKTTAFDIAPRAIEICRERFADSAVEYRVENLLNPPAEWLGAFDLVVESYTLQVLPESLRRLAFGNLARLPRPGGTLLLICRGRADSDPLSQFPWPLSQEELAPLEASLTRVHFEDFLDDEDPPMRRFRIEYRSQQ